MRTATVLALATAALAAAACRNEPAEQATESAEEINEKRQDLADEQQDVTESRASRESGEALEERAEVAHAAADLSRAEVEFERRREVMVQELRFRHHVFATQTAVARGMLADPALPEDARQDATDKILTLERELGEAQLAVDAVATATAAQWDGVRTTVDNAFQQLEGAHDDAFDALGVERKTPPPEAEAPPAY